MNKFSAQVIQSMNVVRSGVYFFEALPLTLISRYFSRPDLPPVTEHQVRTIWKQIFELHKREAEHLARGTYSWQALERENPIRHMRSYWQVMSDGVRVAWRMHRNKTHEFSTRAEALKEGLPDYYTRNFHFQTDGYLSEASARRYDHQVEILFSGAAGAMRRLILPVLAQDAEAGGHWLELGCGTGSTTRVVLGAFPEVRVTALDLSAPYLKVAQENLRPFGKVDFLQGDASRLIFQKQSFSAVYSVYLFHELPRVERRRILKEAYRVLKPGGILLVADSLQMDDEPELNWALERFPKAYHEPFYTDYSRDRLEDLLTEVTDQPASSTHAFFTKVAWIRKPQARS